MIGTNIGLEVPSDGGVFDRFYSSAFFNGDQSSPAVQQK